MRVSAEIPDRQSCELTRLHDVPLPGRWVRLRVGWTFAGTGEGS